MKQLLLTYCLTLASKKATALENELRASREGSQSESKSSAGDKHETGRAMMHLEQEKLHQQLAEAKTVVAELERVDGAITQKKGALGSLIKTNKGLFLIAAGLGRVTFEETDYFVVSVKAPIAIQFLGKVVGNTISMNGNTFEILLIE